MIIPKEFDDIRPWEPEELPEVYKRLISNETFKGVLTSIYPGVPMQAIAAKLALCKTGLDFQKVFCYDFIYNLMGKVSKGFELDTSALDVSRNFTFISNHRDIVADSALLDVLLLDNGFKTTCEIAIGDNLLTVPWVKDLVRINKSFIVERGLPMRQMLMASKRLSDYMHFSINEKKENIWIAQREGRAKDSDDRTQEAVLKMMAMGGSGSIIERLVGLHIAPLTISYEYDPCDFLKAQEFQQKRDDPSWKKAPGDDIKSMNTGIFGIKGHVHYHAAPCLDDYLMSLDSTMPKVELYKTIAEHIDHEIHSNYRLYSGNYVALDELNGNDNNNCKYSAEEKSTFDSYIAGQLAKISIPNRDDNYLKERILTMYANPARNYLKTL